MAVPYSYPLDYPETHNPLAYFAALWRERGGGESGGTGHRHWAMKLLCSGTGRPGSSQRWDVEPWVRGCSCLCATGACVWTHNNGNGNNSQVNPPPQEHPPPFKCRVLGDKNLSLLLRLGMYAMEMLPVWKRARGQASPMMTNVTQGGSTKLGKPCEGSQVGSIPCGLAPATRLRLPACKSALGTQGRESVVVNEGLGRRGGLHRCRGLSTVIYPALKPDHLESVPSICAIQTDTIQQAHTSLNKGLIGSRN